MQRKNNLKKIIVTGATSMLGTALIEVAVREGVDVYAVIRKDTKRRDRLVPSPHMHIVYASLENLDETEGLSADCDVFYHFAWAGTVRATRDEPEIHEKNIRYSLEAVKLAKKSGCRRFVGAGSQAEYGPVYGRIDGQTRYAPTISYGIAKYAAGIMSRKQCEKYGMDHIWGRVFSIYGPHDNEGSMLEHAISCWDNGEIARFSSGMQYWNYLYESDAGEMFYRLGCDEVPSGTYFVANQESKVLKEYIGILMQAYGNDAKAEFAKASGTILPGLEVDMDRTLKALGYIPQIRFENGIRKMIEAKSAKAARIRE